MLKKKAVNSDKPNIKELKTNNEKTTKLNDVMRDINKSLGKGAIKFGIDEEIKEKLPTGIQQLDKFIGGGFPKGNFSILWGGNSAGKTSLAYHIIAENQKKGNICALLDVEHSFSSDRAGAFGVDLNKLVLVTGTTNAEEAMDAVITLAKNKVVDFMVIDSIQALSPRGDQETKTGALKSVEDDTMALLARKMAKFLNMSKDAVYQGKVGVLLIGQIRTGGLGGYAPSATLTGGNAKDHFSLLTLFIKRGPKADAPTVKYKLHYKDDNGKERYKTEDKIIGFNAVIRIDKQKITGCSKENEEIRLPYYYDTGFKTPDLSDTSKYDEYDLSIVDTTETDEKIGEIKGATE